MHNVEFRQPEFAVERERSRQAAKRLDTMFRVKQEALLAVAKAIDLPLLTLSYQGLLACVTEAPVGSEDAAEQLLAPVQIRH